MASFERLDLSGELCLMEGCTILTFNDTTGSLVSLCNDEQNDEGYGLVDGITVAMVTRAVLNVYYPAMTIPYIFTFTIASGVITKCVLTDINLVETDITTNLESTVFPLVDFQVNLSAYGVTFPTMTDGVINWDYTITGSGTNPSAVTESFSYTTSDSILSSCITECCIANSYNEVDLNCDCLEDKVKNIQLAEFFLNAAKFAMDSDNDEKADGFITKAYEICNSNCETC